MLTITSEILIAYSQCHRKAYFLLFEKEQGITVEHIEILKKREKDHQQDGLNSIATSSSEITLTDVKQLKYLGTCISKVNLIFDELQAECDLLCIEQVEEGNLDNLRYEPRIFTGTYSVTKEQKLNLLFIGYLLQKILKTPINKGKIITIYNRYHSVKLENNSKFIEPLINPLKEWVKTSPSEPPPVILNKHCPYCQFQVSCRNKAEQDDDLSLLASMTAKSWHKYHRRGIFTIQQLSYLYRPKRQSKNKKKTVSRHKPELQALSIRTGKIYLQDIPILVRQKVEIFLDIEGIPDQNFYYLIGLLILVRGQVSCFSFWADDLKEEEKIWFQLLEKINLYPESPIYHYGSYEPKALKKLAKRYSEEEHYNIIEKRLINVNHYIYGKIYFPVYSNSLKELGKYLGASWSDNLSSGLQSLVYRYRWEEHKNTKIQRILITYNREDCKALKVLTDFISSLQDIANTNDNIDFVDQPKQFYTKKRRVSS